MLVPLGDDDVCILINDSLDLLEVTGLDAHPLHKDKPLKLPLVGLSASNYAMRVHLHYN